jgi:hypothetical protein
MRQTTGPDAPRAALHACFQGNDMTEALLVLSAWAVGGVAVTLLTATLRTPRSTA